MTFRRLHSVDPNYMAPTKRLATLICKDIDVTAEVVYLRKQLKLYIVQNTKPVQFKYYKRK
jgi:hypothetical protein